MAVTGANIPAVSLLILLDELDCTLREYEGMPAFDLALLRLRDVSRDLELKEYDIPEEGRRSAEDTYDHATAAVLNLMED
jgi:hypothetical protein